MKCDKYKMEDIGQMMINIHGKLKGKIDQRVTTKDLIFNIS